MVLDYKKLGLICGIEIHQQVDTDKLFCPTPSILREDKPDFVIERSLHAVAGEQGKVDVAALHEQLKEKRFLYEGYDDTISLVEVDEAPPIPMNEESLRLGLQVCKILKSDVPDVVQVMRKTVIDGSNTSGFQRTALIGRGGAVTTSQGKVRIDSVCMEEDSARPIREEEGYKVYRLDRLGIPLIEIATAPDIKTPQQCKETAQKIGMILRSTRKVKRGLGTIRQDVNVSIKGSTRVEIKGAQDLKMMPHLVDVEIMRQMNLLDIKNKLSKVKQQATDNFIDVTELFKKSESTLIQVALKKDHSIVALKLPGFAGLIGQEVVEGIRLGKELSSYAQARASVKGILHSDELPKFGITQAEVDSVRKKLSCKKEDAFVLCAAQKIEAEKALEGVLFRILWCGRGVPPEVRRANPDGTTKFMRPMPGAARMYPETDVPLIYPILKGIKSVELIDEKIKRFVKTYGLSSDLGKLAAKSNKAELFEELAKKHNKIKPAYIAETLISSLREIKKTYKVTVDNISDDNFRDLFDYLEKGDLHKDIVLDALIDYAKKEFSLKKFKETSTEDLHKKLQQIVKKNTGAPFGALMGMAMKELKGKASGEKISSMLKEILGGHGAGKDKEKVKN